MVKSAFIGFRATPLEREQLETIRRARDLPSLSETARAIIHQAIERAGDAAPLLEERREVQNGARS